MTVTCVLLAVQGVVGGIQYQLELPAEIVWIHVALAASLWLSLLWGWAAAGSVAPHDVASADQPSPAAPELVRS